LDQLFNGDATPAFSAELQMFAQDLFGVYVADLQVVWDELAASGGTIDCPAGCFDVGVTLVAGLLTGGFDIGIGSANSVEEWLSESGVGLVLGGIALILGGISLPALS
ncbi:MAG: hypothetical protein ACRDTN_18975, partial [Mycobacterium sp.]